MSQPKPKVKLSDSQQMLASHVPDRAYSFVLSGAILCAVVSCSAPHKPSPQHTEPCTEAVASTAGLSPGRWDNALAEKRIPELLSEHSIPHELGSGEWHVLVPPQFAEKARKLLGAAIDAENLAARIEPTDPAVLRPYELPAVVIVRCPASATGSERFKDELLDRLWGRKESQHTPSVLGANGPSPSAPTKPK